MNFPIWNFGEGGVDPDDYGFKFKAGDEWYHIQVWSIIHRLDTETRLGVDRSSLGID